MSFSLNEDNTSENINPFVPSLYNNGNGIHDQNKQKDLFIINGPLVFPQEDLADHVYVSITQETIYKFKAFLG